MATNGEAPAAGLTGDSSRGSLHTAAAVNAGLQRDSSRRSSNGSLSRTRSSQADRRRSAVVQNLQANDPNVPAPGEMATEGQNGPFTSASLRSGSPLTADPNHHRAPSLGELHQELEAEQEAHVNRLLQMIRQQQLELQRLQANPPPHGSAPLTDDTSAVAERSYPSTPQVAAFQPPTPGQGHHHSGSLSRSSISHPRSSFEMARADLQRRSRTPSRGAPSPRLRSGSISAESGDWVLGGRDESAFYQAETQMLTRENQMLRHRVRELEKQLAEASGTSPSTTEPQVPSQLARSSGTEGTSAEAKEDRR